MAYLPAVPATRDMEAWTVEPIPDTRGEWRVVFSYPGCSRTFDGRNWTVEARDDAQ